MSQKNLSFIITSGGKGLRFGKTRKGKQFELVNGVPIFIYPLKAISEINNQTEIILTIDKSIRAAYIEKLLKKYSLDKNVMVCYGGPTRARSVFNGFKKIKRQNGYVVIHDSVRPCFDLKKMNQMIKSINNYSGIILASKIQDTVKKIKNNNLVKNTIGRDNLWISETPQIFRYSILKKCYEMDLKFFRYTDESELLEHNGFRVRIFENNQYNNKITTKKDLEIYKLLFKNV